MDYLNAQCAAVRLKNFSEMAKKIKRADVTGTECAARDYMEFGRALDQGVQIKMDHRTKTTGEGEFLFVMSGLTLTIFMIGRYPTGTKWVWILTELTMMGTMSRLTAGLSLEP